MTTNSDAVSKRILSELESLKIPKVVKSFLKDILDFEMEILDQGKPQYIDDYKQKIEELLCVKEVGE